MPAVSQPRSPLRQSDTAYELLKQLIVECQVAPGALVDERDLMERLEVGRTPLREALQRLERDHLIQAVPRHGYFVAHVTVANLAHAFELRQPVEGLAARLAAERATKRHLDDLVDYLAEVERDSGHTTDRRWHLSVDKRFHDLVAAASGNPYLQHMVDELFNLTARLFYMSQAPITLVHDELPAYRAVIGAIRSGDPGEAERAMRVHVEPLPMQLVSGAIPRVRDGAAPG